LFGSTFELGWIKRPFALDMAAIEAEIDLHIIAASDAHVSWNVTIVLSITDGNIAKIAAFR
jgi:hypothetical protein